MFALKAMNRKQIKFKKASSLVTQEYEILRVLVEKPSPFVVALHYSFADFESVYFCLNLLSGGDLRFHLEKVLRFQKEQARFLIGQIALGLGHLHKLGILYRDLKPENIMLDDKGNCVITDLGLAVRFTNDKLYCRGRTGTSGYWAPEVLSKQKYSFPADWWSLGVMLYELIVGMGPFSRRSTGLESRDEGTEKHVITYTQVSKIIRSASYSKESVDEDSSDGLIDLLTLLLNRNPEQRLCTLETLMEAQWFQDFDWYKVKTCKYKPLYVPESDGAINAEAAQDIAEGAAKKMDSFKNVELMEKDDFANMWCVASQRHQEDIVAVLEMEREGELDYLEPPSSGCCAVQ